jgi:hypothetical protein
MGKLARHLLVVALALGCAVQARAQAASQVSEQAGDSDLRARLDALDAYLADLQRPSRAYFGTWVGLLGALGAGQATLYLVDKNPDNQAQRTGYLTGASLSVIGALAVAFTPSPGRQASTRFRSLPERTRAEQLAKLEAGERWLAREARVTRRSQSWWVHLIGVGVGLGLTLGLGLGYEDNWRGALTSGIGALGMTATRIWTRPRRSIHYDERYRARPTAPPKLTLLPTRIVLQF